MQHSVAPPSDGSHCPPASHPPKTENNGDGISPSPPSEIKPTRVREPSENQFQTCRASIASIENTWSGSICCMRCTNCSASSRVSNIILLYNRPARTWSHLHIVSVIALPPSNRLSSRFSSQITSAYLSSPLLLSTTNTFPGDMTHSTRQSPRSTLKKEGAPL